MLNALSGYPSFSINHSEKKRKPFKKMPALKNVVANPRRKTTNEMQSEPLKGRKLNEAFLFIFL